MAFPADDVNIPAGGKLVGAKIGQLYDCCPTCNPKPITVKCCWSIYEFPYNNIEDFLDIVGENSIGCDPDNIYE